MVKDKLEQRGKDSVELKYYDRLASLFERVAWITILWAFILNSTSPSSLEAKNYTFLLLFIAAIFNLGYFRYFYYHLRTYSFRFYFTSLLFPLLIWVFIHLHAEFLSYFLLPYYVLILATSLTLKKTDVVIALVSSLLFLILETTLLRLPLDSQEQAIALGQISALLIFTWVALKLAHLVAQERGETLSIRDEIVQEEKKSAILKEYTSELVLDRQKAQVLLEEYPGPLLLLDNKNHLIEINDYFKKLSDFKDERLVGKDLGYVLKLEKPLNFDQKSFVPEDFEGSILTRRNKVKKIHGRAHFLLGRDQRLKQVLILFTNSST